LKSPCYDARSEKHQIMLSGYHLKHSSSILLDDKLAR